MMISVLQTIQSCAQSYTFALTTAAQNDFDTLISGEVILKQFKEDNPFTDAIYKCTDKTSNFSSS